MTLQEALIVLAKHQQWRQGADIEIAKPKVLTEALDIVLAYHHVGTNKMIETNKTMTAVEWLFQKLWDTQKDKFTWHSIFEQSKEMEKQQIIDAFWNGDNTDCISEQNSKEFAEQYYKETYGSKLTKKNK